MIPEFPKNMRLILAHKQATSARVRFLCFEHGLFAFEALPDVEHYLPFITTSGVAEGMSG
jgi:hypothetical protein